MRKGISLKLRKKLVDHIFEKIYLGGIAGSFARCALNVCMVLAVTVDSFSLFQSGVVRVEKK